MRTHLVLASLLLAACRPNEGVGFEKFVSTTVELRKLQAQAPNAADFAARKRALMGRLGVTDADLDAYVRSHADDVKLMSAAWDSVEARLQRASDSASARRTGSPGSMGPGPVVGGPPRGPNQVPMSTTTAAPTSSPGATPPPAPHP